MNDVLRELHRKMDEIIGRQERSLSVLTAIQVNWFGLLSQQCCEQIHPHSIWPRIVNDMNVRTCCMF